jgi:hypothetical protein
MTETETEVEEPETEATVPVDPVPDLLYTWGLSGEPLRMAPTQHQPIIAAIRGANVSELTAAEVQPLLDNQYPGAGYQATDFIVDHPPTGTFTVAAGDEPGEFTFTSDDNDLALPVEHVSWDFGDRTKAAGGQVSHTFPSIPGTYTVTSETVVAGRVYASRQDVVVQGGAAPVVDRLEPNNAVLGSEAFTLRVHGSGFTENTVILFNEGQELTTFVSPNELTTGVQPETATVAGTVPVAVLDSVAGRSNSVGFDFTGAAPIGAPEEPETEEPETEEPEPEPIPQEEFHPSDYTVDEVLDYVDDHPDEVDRLIGEEETGKARVTLLEKLYALQPEE